MVMEEQESDMELDSERVPVPQVQKAVQESHLETVNNITNISRSKPRLRKKALHAAILKQMEFYFSDANLNKDRFLSNLLKEDPYVDLNVFTSFNKIKDLTTDVNRIAKALEASTMLSLSEDGLKVRRITRMVPKENIEDCTVYVQNLPPDTDHETLSSIFSEYSQVVYISIPRFQNNKKLKGFGFVEFATPEGAKKCLKAFQKKGCVLPSYTAPDELLSIATFNDAEKDITLKGKQVIANEENNYNEDTAGYEDSENVEINKNNEKNEEYVNTDNTSENHENKNKKKIKKRKHKDTESSETGEMEKPMDSELIKNKKQKFKHSDDVYNAGANSSDEKQTDISLESASKKSNKCKKSVSINEEQVAKDYDKNDQMVTDNSAILTTEEQENTNEKKKKRKNRKKRSKMEDFSYCMGLQVMAKKDWKYLRNKYLELQRSKMKQLKQHLRKTRWNQWSNYEKNKPEKEENDEKDNPTTCRFSFTPGVIVKIEMDKPCTDPKGFKIELKANSFVKYIDVEDGSCLAYIRCDTNENAQTFTQKPNEERHMTILEGKSIILYTS
ncbi:La-related protein 7 [Habropoda laboriosa]|uniref:La-related protein 7 n=1 Tax=Habropoda laboriosa TaxID=597456 RepID=A0A0L7QQJ3_9HYME|nr:La-related protein 7 [Habropoda laboriosa]